MDAATKLTCTGICLILSLAAASLAQQQTQFTRINGLLCIRPEFTKSHPEAQTGSFCALLCRFNQMCQAFNFADPICLLYVFNKCSKYVRDCNNCSRWGQIWVKQQARLNAGSLCPSGFANDYCGTKYKLYPGITNWNVGNSTVANEPGMVTLADAVDISEMTFLQALVISKTWNMVLTGAYQLPGSQEPAGGWIWVSCNNTVSPRVWKSDEPSNHGNVEHYGAIDMSMTNLNDYILSSSNYVGVLAECVSPFD